MDIPSDINSSQNVVLVAEDDDISYALIEILLSKQGNKVLRAYNGKQALQLFKENPNISLILMDLKMPIMDGYEATREIRKTNTEVPIIAQTAYALAGDDKKALAAGCNDYVSKPIKRDNLMEKVEAMLRQTSG